MQNIKVENLNEFQVNKIDFDLVGMRLNITFTLPKARVIGDYNMNFVMDEVEYWGEGPFEMIAHSTLHYIQKVSFNLHHLTAFYFLDVKMVVDLRLKIIEDQLNLHEFLPTLLMDSVTSNFEDIMGSDGSGELFNAVIEQMLPLLLESQQEEVSESIADSVMDPVNEELSTMKLIDLMH